MGESPATAPERDVLLATKLHVPASRPGLVPRPRLTARLDEGLARGLVLVCAPAGYGKTVLLADWARRGGLPAAWLSLDAGDNDPARFWRHVVAALDRARPGTGDRVAPLLGPPAPSSFQGLVTALINDLAADEARLVLDDYHVIDSPEVHASLGFLFEHRPAGVCVGLASRSDPPLALARMRARGQVTEIRGAELRFAPAEAADLLQHAAAALPDASVAALAARTEGWAAGLQLAALSLRGQADAAAFVAAFTGSHRYVLDYLAEEVLERQDEQLRTFLLETSVLDRLSGPLCDAVTAREGSQALLEEVERAGLFLMPLDEVRGWWRYITCSPTCSAPGCNKNSPDAWPGCTATRPPGTSIMDWPTMPSATRPPPARCDGRPGSSSSTSTWFTTSAARPRPSTAGCRSSPPTWSGPVPACCWRRPSWPPPAATLRKWSRSWTRLSARRPTGPMSRSSRRPASRRATWSMSRPRPRSTGAISPSFTATPRPRPRSPRRPSESKPEERMLSASAHGFLAIAEWLRGRLTEAEHAFASSVTGWREIGQLTITAWGYYSLALVRRAQGRLDAAALTCKRALDTLVTAGRLQPAAGLGYVGLAEIAYQRDELGNALRYATEGIALCRQFVYTPPLANGLATLAMIRQATGDPAGALAAIAEAGQASPGPAGMLNPVPAQRARLLLAQGDLAAAARFPQENGLTPDDEPNYAREPGHLTLARILLAQDRSRQALALLDRLHAAAVAQDHIGSLIETGALRALALAATGDEAGAVTTLAEALLLACPQGHVRVFADEGPPMAALLGRIIAAQHTGQAAAQVPLGYLVRLQRAFDAGQSAPDAVPSGIVDQLTGRELEVLKMLAAGRSNQAIARELVVTLDTVKKHVGHVLGKLGAANRTEAVARARELTLIP